MKKRKEKKPKPTKKQWIRAICQGILLGFVFSILFLTYPAIQATTMVGIDYGGNSSIAILLDSYANMLSDCFPARLEELYPGRFVTVGKYYANSDSIEYFPEYIRDEKHRRGVELHEACHRIQNYEHRLYNCMFLGVFKYYSELECNALQFQIENR